MELNAQQNVAVKAIGPIIIIAGPGTGKTKTLTARILHLLQQSTPASAILALTFTKKAAEEMRQRVGNAEVQISTFHALCHRMLGGDLAFVSEPERLMRIKSLSRPAELKHVSVRELGLRISRAKNGIDEGEQVAHMTRCYTEALTASGLLDFDDLLLRARDRLRDNPRAKPIFSYILVDEFQDTNSLQYEILQLLRSNDEVCVIGDPNQSIYGFRGASSSIFDTFKHDFPHAKTITLSMNYRSSSAIVALSNAIFGTHQQSFGQASGQVTAVQVLNEYAEARFIVNDIQKNIGGSDLLNATHGHAGHDLGDFAILYRNRSVAITLQKLLADSGLPYQVVGEGSPYEQPDVQRLIALLRIVSGGQAEVSSFTRTQVDVLLGRIKNDESPVQIAQQIVRVFGFAASPEVDQFIGTLVRFKTITHAVEHIDAIAAQNFYDPQAKAITLLTIHASKGLEFPCVFLIGAEEGILPHDKADITEEKRLLYVAITRAKNQLCILHANKRGGKPAKISRFVSDIADAILPKTTDPAMESDKRRAAKYASKRAQTSLF